MTISPSSGEAPSGTVTMPDVTGMTVDEALTALGEAGFTGTMFQYTEASTDVPPGSVISTDPAAGTPVAPNADIKVYVSG